MPPRQPQRPPLSPAERALNLHVHTMLESPAGREVMAWLRRITIETVAGPEVSNDALRHLEGQRFIVGVLATRKDTHSQTVKEDLHARQLDPDERAGRRAGGDTAF